MHWAVGHNSCKGAKSDFERKSLLDCSGEEEASELSGNQAIR